MNLNETQIKEIQELAGLFLEPEEIAVLLKLDSNAFLQEIEFKNGVAYDAYFKGKTTSKKEIHENVVKMAKHGSPQAEEMAKDMMYKQNLAERRVGK